MMNSIDLSGAVWFKSTKSTNGNCVEVAHLQDGHVGVRDSKNRGGSVFIFTPGEWNAFVAGVKAGEFDR
jgi:hypothetical protein